MIKQWKMMKSETEQEKELLNDQEIVRKKIINLSQRLWVSTSFLIIILCGLNHLLGRRAGDKIAWFTMNKETVFGHMKMVYFPWIIVWGFMKFYLRKRKKRLNTLATSLGLLLTICLIAVFYHIYTRIFKLNTSIALDMVFGSLSVIAGCGFTSSFRKEKNSWWFENLVAFITYFGLIVYFTTCTYIDCSDVYFEVYNEGQFLSNLN